MKRIGTIGLMVGIALVAVAVNVRRAAAQAPADRAAIEKQLVANERAINAAFAKGDAKGFLADIAKDGVSVDPMGVSKAVDFEKMLPQAKIESWNIDSTQVVWVSPQTAVLIYRWTGKGTYMGQPVPSPTWASTVWTNRDGKWQAVFHQETAAAPPPPVKK